MMTRNTEKRVEVACPVYDPAVKRQLNHLLKVMLSDNVKARILTKDGTYRKREQGAREVNAQEVFMQEALRETKERKREPQVFRRLLDLLHKRNKKDRREEKNEYKENNVWNNKTGRGGFALYALQ